MYNLCMAGDALLSASDREFFELVSRAAFTNPFSDEWLGFDVNIAGCPPNTPHEERRALVKRNLSDRLRKLEAEGTAEIRRYPAESRYQMQSAFLFDVFMQFNDVFDRLILDQIKAGDRPCLVSFAQDALARLARRGFTAVEAERYFAIFYQLRRAYFFIGHGFIGQSPCMKQLRLHLWDNVFTHDIRWYDRYLWNRMEDFSTLLLGETGTGKGTAAAAIGRSGFIPYDGKKRCFAESFTRGFVSLNLSQFPETLLESELFGHKKGAFTGAVDAHEGVFARCSPYGAIFLDEIGDISVPVQIKLLQILQDRTFTPVGSHEKLRFRGRVIAATNKPLGELRLQGLFRDDFYYRLCSDIIKIPPLRQRIQEDPGELEELLAHLLARMTGEISGDALEMVRNVIEASLGKNYAWPGNVRELEQAVRQILVTRRYEGDHKAVAPDLRSQLFSGIESGDWDADRVLSAYCTLLYERHGTYEEVARRTNLDRRTAKAYLEKHHAH